MHASPQAFGRQDVAPVRSLVGVSSMLRIAGAICLLTSLVAVSLVTRRDFLQAVRQSDSLYTISVQGLELEGDLQDYAQASRNLFLRILATPNKKQQDGFVKQVRQIDAKVSVYVAKTLLRSGLQNNRELQRLTDSWEQYMEVRNDCIALVNRGRNAEALSLESTAGAEAFGSALASVQQIKTAMRQQAELRFARVQSAAGRVAAELCEVAAALLLLFVTLLLLSNARRRQFMAALIHSEQKWRDLFEGASDLIYQRDLHGRITAVNRQLENALGYCREELLGLSVAELIVPESLPKVKRMQSELIQKGHTETAEIEIIRKDGERVALEISTSLVYENNKPAGVLGVGRDITLRRQAEVALIRAKDNAERLSQAKSDFLANMNHELRTPLNGILGMTELALMHDLPEEVRDYLGTVKSCGNDLYALISDILDISKIEAGRLIIQRAPFHLQSVIKKCVVEAEALAADKSISFTVDWDRCVPVCLIGDAPRLQQILSNYLRNAVKFTDRGLITVKIRANRPDEGTVRVRMSVTDTGVGIDPRDQAILFQKFTQVDGSNTRRHGGSGLGLAIIKELASAMDGLVGVSSTLGKGATFWVEIPFQVPSSEIDSERTSEHFLSGACLS